MPLVRDQFDLAPGHPTVVAQGSILRSMVPLMMMGHDNDLSESAALAFLRQGYRVMRPEEVETVALASALLDHLESMDVASEETFEDIIDYHASHWDVPEGTTIHNVIARLRAIAGIEDRR